MDLGQENSFSLIGGRQALSFRPCSGSVGDEDCSRKIGRWRIVTVGGESSRRPPGRPKGSGAGAVGRREVETPLPRHGCLILTLWTPSSSSFSFPPPSFPLPPPRLRSPPVSMTTPHVIASSSAHHSSQSATSNGVVGNHFRVGKKIGEGSFGVVFEGALACLCRSFQDARG